MIRIRPVAAPDLSGIAVIEDECFGTERFPLSCFRGYLQRVNSVFLLAEEGAEPAGYVLGAIDNRFRPPLARLDSLAVRRPWRRRGLGRRLVDRFEREARHCGAGAVTLEVEATNSGAKRLYRQAGYRRADTLPDYYGRGRHGLRLVKRLSLRYSGR